ncbi:DUF5691 domain-containing protein [Methylobacterium sp. A49B]|uniref:Uncharacterized protein n=1 Tax=Methylobacterium mesophilicum SR1.6/6 TaxID=908290 RepID=A0A6B9FKB0_9HYPH|nr:DUF5691 domain-containing protein [Methylobacterium mesophilicum]QGY02442.1 hypothetical protein MMSR116_11595 [Methylobacterium mesophilicum SR1.6/6]
MEAVAASDPDWDAALAAALLGADRVPSAASNAPLPGLDPVGAPGGALLAQIAVQGLVHRAAAGLGPEALRAAPERPVDGPECPPAAARRLQALLAAGSSAEPRRREWFALAAEAGLRAPSWLHAELAGVRGGEAALARSIAGAELDWLARACGAEIAAPDAAAAAAEGEAENRVDDSPADRYRALIALRQRDPDGARDALVSGFKAEKAKLRAQLLSALDEGLNPADEPFLEGCLDDRAAEVRACAQRLLTRLPGSRLGARMAERARTALAIESRRHLLIRTRHALVVTLPEEAPDLVRDGIEPNAYARDDGGRRAGLLRDILAAAPLGAFADHPPRLWVDLALQSEWSIPLLEGFLRCVSRERDPVWIHAMAEGLFMAWNGRLPGVKRADALTDLWARSVGLMPAPAWEEAVASLLHSHGVGALPLLAKAPPHFSPTFTDALMSWIAAVSRGTGAAQEALTRAWIIGRFGNSAAPTERAAAAAASILAGLPEGEGSRLRGQLASLAETLELRAAMRREFGNQIAEGRALRT